MKSRDGKSQSREEKKKEDQTRRRMARERRGAGSSVVRIEALYYKPLH